MSAARPCNAREPGGVLRCELNKGHRGDHKAMPLDEVAAEAFGAVTWPSHRAERTRRQASSRPVRTHSDPGIERQSYLDGRHDGQIKTMWRDRGRVYCERCGKPGPLESDGLVAAREWLHQHHPTLRSRGRGYRFVDRDPGVDLDLEYLCAECHVLGPKAAHA